MLTRPLRRVRPHGRVDTASRTRAALAIGLVAVLSLTLTACQDADTQHQEGLLLNSLQKSRQAARLAPLAGHAGLLDIARRHAEEMAGSQRLSHSPDFVNRVSAVLPNWTGIAENVAYGTSMDAVHKQLMASAPHRANILGNYSLVGVGVSRDGTGRYWVVQIFART